MDNKLFSFQFKIWNHYLTFGSLKQSCFSWVNSLIGKSVSRKIVLNKNSFRTIAPKENCARLGLRFSLGLVTLGGNFPRCNCPRTEWSMCRERILGLLFYILHSTWFLWIYILLTSLFKVKNNVVDIYPLCFFIT